MVDFFILLLEFSQKVYMVCFVFYYFFVIRMRRLFVVSIFSAALIVSACGSTPSIESREELAQCITDAGWSMYGAYWCSHCKAQKQLFGTAFENINYIECTEDGENGQPEVCAIAGVIGYPTWISTGGEKLHGEQSLEALASAAGCVVAE